MSNFNAAPFSNTLIGSTSNLISQPDLVEQEGSGKSKKKRSVSKKLKKPKSNKKPKKKVVKKVTKKVVKKPKKKVVKEIDTYNKPQLERLAKKHGVSLKKRDGSPKTKLELYKSLKRKKLI
jgi:hypothetical protein